MIHPILPQSSNSDRRVRCRRSLRVLAGGLCLALAACAPPPPPAPAPEPEPEPVPPFPAEVVWTRSAEVALDTGLRRVAIERIFQRLDVVGRDTIGLRVRCGGCPDAPEGYVEEAEIVYEAVPPGVAMWGELPDFALAIREAAAQRDLEALVPVMAPEFTFSFVGQQSPATAIEVWRAEGFTSLDRLIELLDGGLTTRDGDIWVAPADFVEVPGYRGLRTGMRQTPDGRWEWLYLIAGIGG